MLLNNGLKLRWRCRVEPSIKNFKTLKKLVALDESCFAHYVMIGVFVTPVDKCFVI